MALPLAAIARAAILLGGSGSTSAAGTMGLKVKANIDQAMRRADRVVKQVYPAALQQALNKTLDRAYTDTVRELANVKQVKRKQLTRNRGRRGMIQKHAAGRYSRKPQAKLWIGVRRVLDGKVDKSGGLKKVVGNSKRRYTKGPLTGNHSQPFAATVGKHSGQFVRYPVPGKRVSHSGKTPGTKRRNLPIQEVSKGSKIPAGISLMPEARTIGNKHTREAMRVTFPRELKRQLNRRLR